MSVASFSSAPSHIFSKRLIAVVVFLRSGRPEDRLRSALAGGLVLFPAAVLGAGWTMETGKGGLALPCVFLCE